MSRHCARICLVAAVALGAVLGCSRGGPPYPLSGSVTYDGKPLPVGEIVFMPDPDRGNEGPGVLCFVRDGRYEMPQGKGHVGGAYVAELIGFDGKPPTNVEGPVDLRGKALFPTHVVKIDLPTGAATHDFVVPAQPQAQPQPKAPKGPPQ